MSARARGYVNYDSLQVTANHRLSGGLAFGTAYTLAKTMSMINALTVYLDPRERLYAYDASDRRHILSFQGSWNLPKGSALWNSAVGRAILDGWQFAGVGFWRSGMPATVTYTTTDANGGRHDGRRRSGPHLDSSTAASRFCRAANAARSGGSTPAASSGRRSAAMATRR